MLVMSKERRIKLVQFQNDLQPAMA